MLIELIITDSERYYRWADTDPQGRWLTRPTEAPEAEFLAAIDGHVDPITLIIPGDLVVTAQLHFEEKERKHLRQLLPYQLEERVIGDVDHLHFALGQAHEGQVTAAYLEESTFSDIIQVFRDANVEIKACYPSFQRLAVEPGQWAIALVGNAVLAHHHSGAGFCCPRGMAKLILADLLVPVVDALEAPPLNVHLYADSDKALDYLNQRLPEFAQNGVTRHLQPSPPLVLTSPSLIDLCQGAYGHKLPISKLWHQWKSVAGLLAACCVVAIAANISEGFAAQSRQAEYKQAIAEQYKQAVTTERVPASPIKRLKSLLGDGPVSVEPSQAVYMLSQIAPLLKSQNVDIQVLDYSNKEQQLLINLQTDSFNTANALVSEITNNTDLSAELKSSQNVGDKSLAQLLITRGGNTDG